MHDPLYDRLEMGKSLDELEKLKAEQKDKYKMEVLIDGTWQVVDEIKDIVLTNEELSKAPENLDEEKQNPAYTPNRAGRRAQAKAMRRSRVKDHNSY